MKFVEFKEARSLVVGTLRLLPGINKFEDGQWEAAKAFPKVGWYLQQGQLVELGEDEAKTRGVGTDHSVNNGGYTPAVDSTAPQATLGGGKGAKPGIKTGPAGSAEGSTIASISEIKDAREAARIVGNMNDADTLKAWRSEETRKDVQKAIDERLKALS